MRRQLFKSKIHRCTVTQADLNYEGSVTIDSTLLEAADILPYERVYIWNVTRGTRLDTYALEADKGSGTVCINGAAAHLVHPGDKVIIATFCELNDEDARKHRPVVVFVDEKNHIRSNLGSEIPGPRLRISAV